MNAIYLEFFGFRTNGIFVEVGAYDGEFASNTSGLADAGWKGLYIEPVWEFAQQCAARHAKNNVLVEQCAVGADNSIANIYVGESLSTTKRQQVEAYLEIEWARHITFDEKRMVQQCTLDSLLVKHHIVPGFELLVVDVEGAEPDVFAGFNLGLWRPQMMIVELQDQHPDFCSRGDISQHHAALRKFIASEGYREVFRDDINTISIAAPIPHEW